MAQPNQLLQTSGINDVYEYNEIHLDSSKADNRGDSDGQLNPRFAITPPVPSVIGIKVLTAQIPFAWNIVTADNNAFSIDGRPYTLPIGNYSVTTLVDQLNSLVATANFNPGVTFGFNQRTGALTIQDSNLAANSLPGVLSIPANGPVSLFGLAAPADVPITVAETDLAGHANATGSNYLLLTSQSLAGRLSKNIRINGETTPHPIVLAKIPVTCDPGGVIAYQDASPGYCFDMGMEQLQHIDLLLLDGDTLKPLPVNSPWSVSLMVLSQRETSVPRIRNVTTKTGTAKRLRVS